MTKSYRGRTLNQRCQVARADAAGKPLQEANGYVLNYSGLWFLKVSGNDHQDHKRLIPEDSEAFFLRKAKEIEDKLKARGKTNVSVTPEAVYDEYVRVFTNPSKTYAPPGHPEEFSIIVPKELCVNWQGSNGNGNGNPMSDIIPEEMSIFTRLAAQNSSSSTHPSDNARASGRRRKVEVEAEAEEVEFPDPFES